MHSQEPSYYEIALTNRQVLGFFVVLLLCVVGAFFSGIWLGKKGSTDLPAFAQAETVTESATDSAEPLEELNFFTDEQAAPAKQPAREPVPERRSPERAEATSAGTATTLKEDLDSSRATRRAAVDPPAREAPNAASTARPAPVEPAKIPMTGFVIQVFSSPDEARARGFLERLRADGYEAFIVREVVDGAATHRVRIGPFAERSEADRLKPEVAKAYNVEPWVAPVE